MSKSIAQKITISVLLLCCLLPFVNKAFHIDDPLFIWTAKQIIVDPSGFYDFSVNWYDYDKPMHEIMKNPPLVSYYISVISKIFGFNEIALHLFFYIPAIFCGIGMYSLSKEFCAQPFLATMIAVLSPVFIISSTNIMSDIAMLNFWVWAVVFWIHGLKKNKAMVLCLSTLFAALSALTKYTGISVVILLFIYSLTSRKKVEKHILFLLIPVGVISGYEYISNILYGHGLFLDAALYAVDSRDPGSNPLINAVIGLGFAGGGVLGCIFFAPFVWSKKSLTGWVLLTAIGMACLYVVKEVNGLEFIDGKGIQWWTILQTSLFIVAGTQIIVLAVADLRRNRDADSLLLFLWILGPYLFASQINWSINGRSILPMVPVVGILIMRRYALPWSISRSRRMLRIPLALFFGAMLSMGVAWADYKRAGAGRTAASIISDRYKSHPQSVWFQGHWGFQYYMEREKTFNPFDIKRITYFEGDLLVIPSSNKGGKNYFFTSDDDWVPVDEIETNICNWLSVHDCEARTGFYSDICGPIPYLFTAVQNETYQVFKIKRYIHIPYE